MATFKVGQRVRVVTPGCCPEAFRKEATILSLPGSHPNPGFRDCYGVNVDGLEPPFFAALGRYWGAAYCFEPLTDPKADAFIERIKKLKPYDEPVVTEREREWDRLVGMKR